MAKLWRLYARRLRSHRTTRAFNNNGQKCSCETGKGCQVQIAAARKVADSSKNDMVLNGVAYVLAETNTGTAAYARGYAERKAVLLVEKRLERYNARGANQ